MSDSTYPQCSDCGPLDYDEVGEDGGGALFCNLCGADLP